MPSVAEHQTPDSEPTADTGCCQASLKNLRDSLEKCAQDEPVKCAAYAFVIGIIFTILPIRQIASLIVRLAFGLIRPALIILGAMKVMEEFDRRKKE